MAREEKFSAGEPIAARPDTATSAWKASIDIDNSIRRVRGYKKVLPSGRSDTSEDVAGGSRWMRGLGTLMFLTLMGIAIYFSAEPLANILERPLSSVQVEGEFRYVSKERTMELISTELNGDFLQLDLMRLKAVVERDPWVEYAALGRRWPDILLVKIVEQRPIARWGEVGFMNQRGEIIHVEKLEGLQELPWLHGSEADASRILQQYQDLSKLLRARGLDVIALSCDQKKSWRLTLKNDIEVVIGRDQVMEKMRRFITVYDQHLNGLWSDVKAIDVRYTNGVAVEWLPETEASKRFIKAS